MKKSVILLAASFALVLGLTSCGASGDNPGRAYMPDMYYSRAYETYGYNDVGGEMDSLTRRGIHYNGLPVPGTVARGDAMPYHFTATTDSGRLVEANSLRNPLDSFAMTKGSLKEAERLYLVNCGICHGTALDGNGPLYNDGNGPYPAKPRTLVDAEAKGTFTDGHFFEVITYGKGSMGSYASQLTPTQRWWVIKYIRSKQGGGAAAKDSSATGGSPVDSAAVAKPGMTATGK